MNDSPSKKNTPLGGYYKYIKASIKTLFKRLQTHPPGGYCTYKKVAENLYETACGEVARGQFELPPSHCPFCGRKTWVIW